jgi:hypothetical protein
MGKFWIYGYKIYSEYDVTVLELWEAVMLGKLTPYTSAGKKIDVDEWENWWTVRIKKAEQGLTVITTDANQKGVTINAKDPHLNILLEDFVSNLKVIEFICKYSEDNFNLAPRNFKYKIDEVEAFLKDRADDVESQKASQCLTPQEIDPQSSSQKNTDQIVKQQEMKNFFHRDGKQWKVDYEGETGTVQNLDGISYIVTLLERPGKSMSCRELYQAVSGKTPNKTISEDAAIDQGLHVGSRKHSIGTGKERKICLEKYQELKEKLPNVGMEEQEEIQKKMKDLMPYLNLKKRNFADPNDKKAQVNIRKRLDTAYEAIRKENMNDLAEYLQSSIVTDDAYGLRYTGPIIWEITIK